MNDSAPGATVAITLPDGKVLTLAAPTSAAEVAKAIGPGLAKAALAARIDGKLADLGLSIPGDAWVEIVTIKTPDALELVRHDAAHVLAEAAKELYPDVQVTIGPVIEDGFYYDFARDKPFTPEDLAALEARMREIVARDEPVTRDVWPRDKAIAYFEGIGERYKAEIVRDLPLDDEIRIYSQGKFIDLCRGPHLPSTGKLPTASKLMKVAGAYWRGDSRNPMLQRIYGTAWLNQADLDAYLHRLVEAERRDHRRLGREMDLFHIQDAAVGAIFWHPKGWILYRQLVEHVRRRLDTDGYVEVNTPMLVDRSLWEASGHWEKFREHMFTTSAEERSLALKPMNCPCHVQVFRQGLKSYRDLPLRMAEFGACHRNEPSGALHGIMRVRAFTQDDAHIFCTPDQVTAEAVKFCGLLAQIYRDFGFEDFTVRFADRPAVRAGEDAVWDKAEAWLKAAVEAADLPYTLSPGEGAFYGPKLEFHLKDAIGRTWQCGTLQLDFVLPERLDANYVAEDGKQHRPVMLHRAILGSLERFVGILIEHYAGRFPMWLAPVQAVVATITNDSDAYASRVAERLKAAGLRVELDARADKIGYKVREHALAKVPVLVAVGRRESETNTVSLRRIGGDAQESLALDEAVARLRAEAHPPV